MYLKKYTIEITYTTSDSFTQPVEVKDCIGYTFQTLEEGVELLAILKEFFHFYSESSYGSKKDREKFLTENSLKPWYNKDRPFTDIIFKDSNIYLGSFVGYFEVPISAKIVEEYVKQDFITEVYF